MSPATNLPAAFLETILPHLAALFLTAAGGDMAAARETATQLLTAYHPETEEEFRLAANIIGFSLHAIQALGQAAASDLPLTRILRIRGSAVSLSRESARSQRRLSQLQQLRRQGLPAETAPGKPAPVHIEPRIEKAIDLIADTSKVASAAKASGVTWSQAYDNRQRDLRIAASLKRAEARIAAQANAGTIAASTGPHNQMARAT